MIKLSIKGYGSNHAFRAFLAHRRLRISPKCSPFFCFPFDIHVFDRSLYRCAAHSSNFPPFFSDTIPLRQYKYLWRSHYVSWPSEFSRLNGVYCLLLAVHLFQTLVFIFSRPIWVRKSPFASGVLHDHEPEVHN